MNKQNDYLEYENPYNKESERASQRLINEECPYQDMGRMTNSEINPYTADAKLCTYRFSRMKW